MPVQGQAMQSRPSFAAASSLTTFPSSARCRAVEQGMPRLKGTKRKAEAAGAGRGRGKKARASGDGPGGDGGAKRGRKGRGRGRGRGKRVEAAGAGGGPGAAKAEAASGGAAADDGASVKTGGSGGGEAAANKAASAQAAHKPLNFGKNVRTTTGVRRFEDQAIALAEMPQDHLDALAKAVFAEPDVLKPLESGLPPLDKSAPKKTTFEPDLSATQEILAKEGTTLSLERVQSAWLFLTCGRLPMPRSDADVQRVWEGDEAKDMKTLTAGEPDQLWFGSEDSWQEKDPREVFDAIQLKLALERAANIRLMRFELQDHLAATSEVEKELNRIATTPAQKVEAQNAISAARASAAAAQDLLRNHQSQTVTVKSADVGEESASTVQRSAPGFATSASGSAEGASTEANVPKYSIPINPGFSAWVRDTHSDAINRMTDRATFLQTSPHVLEEEREPKLEELNLEVNAFYERLQAEWLQFSSHTQDEWKRRARENQSQPGPNA